MATSYEIPKKGPGWSFHPFWGRGVEWSNEPPDDDGNVSGSFSELGEASFSDASALTTATATSLPWYPQPGTGC